MVISKVILLDINKDDQERNTNFSIFSNLINQETKQGYM